MFPHRFGETEELGVAQLSPQTGHARDYNPTLSRMNEMPQEGARSLKTRDSAAASEAEPSPISRIRSGGAAVVIGLRFAILPVDSQSASHL